jgi:hypothetical protein
MLFNWLNLFGTQKNTQLLTYRELQFFVNFDYDTVGWYALGHHDTKEFLAAVAQQDTHTNFSTDQVQLTWAIFKDDNFETFDIPVKGSQPITLVEHWGACDSEFKIVKHF